MNAILRMRLFVLSGVNATISNRLGELRAMGIDAEVTA
jgi:hypothetical protein